MIVKIYMNEGVKNTWHKQPFNSYLIRKKAPISTNNVQ